MILKFKVYEQTISLQSTKSEPRQGSKDYLELQFSFSADWNDLSKYVYLQHGEVSVPHDLVEESIIVDEYFTEQTEFNVTLLGKSADGSVEVPTNVVTVFLKESNNLWEKDAPEPQNSWVVQVVDARDAALAAAIRAENAAIHQPYPNAETGTWWVWNADSGAYTDTGVSAGSSITVDSELSATSTNPVQNKVIKSALDAKLSAPDDGAAYKQLVTDGNGNTQWEDRLVYSETIEWDGNAEGKEIIGGVLVLLKKIPGITLEKVLDGTFNSIPIIDIPFDPVNEDIYAFIDFFLVTKDNVSFEGMTFPYAGIYVAVNKPPFTMCIPMEMIKNEYLPKNYQVVFRVKYNSTGSDSSVHCNCSYEELKSFCIGKSVPILGSLYDGNMVKGLAYIEYSEEDATIYLQFNSGLGDILKLSYKQDGSITRPLE